MLGLERMAKKTVAGTSADPTIMFSKLHVDGKTLMLAFDFNAIAQAESETGLNLLQAMQFDSLTARQYRAVFYASLLKAQPLTSLLDAGDLITLRNLPNITDAMVSAWSKSIPDPSDNPQTVEAQTT